MTSIGIVSLLVGLGGVAIVAAQTLMAETPATAESQEGHGLSELWAALRHRGV
jgi:hypothetical protein